MVGPLDRGIYLASRSPRRRELLAQIGVRYHLLLFRSRPESPPDVDETVLANEAPDTYVERVARAEMLASLSGQRHEVLTAVALMRDDEVESALSRSEVQFKKLSPAEIAQYVATGESDDKAGAYAIQGRAARFVVELRGSYSGVMGLPLYETSQLLEKLRDRRNPY